MKSAIKLTPEFKAQTTKAILSIVLFIITYLILILFAIGLTLSCVYGAMMLVTNHASLITLIVAVGMVSMGVLVLIFVVKFIFKSHKVDRSHLVEITRADEPDLFKMIDDIVVQVDTTFPKKVYLSSDVNACVFYDSNFWSMFFPVRKNLQIGLALVNCVSKEELKAILAHEFGHFSQKTMKVGSYVYNVNQVIFNMLYDNEGYDKLISSWGNINGYMAFFVAIAFKIVEAIQWVLGKMYAVVNKSYMALSREMEFHADEIAANVTGHEPLKNSLLRLEFANHSFNSVLSFYEGKIVDNFKSENLYKEHSFVMNHLANDNLIPVKNTLPQVTLSEINKFNKSKLVIKDQWASHPSTEDRIKRLESLNLNAQNDIDPLANAVFKNIEQTQKELTEKLFSGVGFKESPQYFSLTHFKNDFQSQFDNNTFSKTYNGYYDNKNPIVFEVENEQLDSNNNTIVNLFSNEKIDLVYAGAAIEGDLQILKQIAGKEIPVKTFDYDGQKYKRKECKSLITHLEKEIEKTNEQIKENDINIFKYFHGLEKQNGKDHLIEKYKYFFDFSKTLDTKYELYNKLTHQLQFINYTTTYEQINHNFLMIEPLEAELKKEIENLFTMELLNGEIKQPTKTNFDLYLSKNWLYFKDEAYIEKNLEVLYAAINDYAFLLSRGYFLLKKDLLDYQVGLIKAD